MFGLGKKKKPITPKGLANSLLQSKFFNKEELYYDSRLLTTYEELKWHSGYLSNITGEVIDKPGADFYLQYNPESTEKSKPTRQTYFCHALAVTEFLTINNFVSLKISNDIDKMMEFTQTFVQDHFLADPQHSYMNRAYLSNFFLNNRKKLVWGGYDFVPYFIKIACDNDLSNEGKKIINNHLDEGLRPVKHLLDNFNIIT